MKTYKYSILGMMLLAAGCSSRLEETVPESGILSFSSSVEGFEEEAATRASLDGRSFENGDKIKLKVICPFSSHTEFGESTYGNSFDNFWLLKWEAGSWTTLTAKDGYDINGDYSPSASPDIYGRFLAQQTPYVFTAQTWSEEQIFIAGGGTRVEQYSNVFHANQTKEADYKASDLLWAQTIRQTGSYNIHLSFRHVMAALVVTIEGNVTDQAVLTLENMPAIDQAEIIVGDYYAAQSKNNPHAYGYKAKHDCPAGDNGKVIGVAVVDDSQAMAFTRPLDQIAQDATYTAYPAGSRTYRLIVPPCTLGSEATFWLRDGVKRYSMQLSQTNFDAGKLYHVTMKTDESN